MMKRNLLIVLVVLNLFLCGCGEGGGRSEEVVYLKTIMPESLVQMANLDVATRDSVAVVGKGESQYLGLRLLPGQPKLHGGIRAEVSVDFPFSEGDRVNYRWRFMIPDDFVSDAPENRWWVIGQWHDQPNLTIGESWENFASRSPPISLALGEIDDQLGIVLTYGLTTTGNIQQLSEPKFIEKGIWHTIETQIDWTRGTTGQVKVFLDGSADPNFVGEGPNMNNAYQHYLKFGMYRHPKIDSDNWIYIDDLTIEANDTR